MFGKPPSPADVDPVLYVVLTGNAEELRRSVSQARIDGWALGGFAFVKEGDYGPIFAQVVLPPMP